MTYEKFKQQYFIHFQNKVDKLYKELTMKYTPKIKKEYLITGEYYYGRCRNAVIARWNGKLFVHWRYKFGTWFLDEIRCPEDEDTFDVFIAERLATKEEIENLIKPIPKVAF